MTKKNKHDKGVLAVIQIIGIEIIGIIIIKVVWASTEMPNWLKVIVISVVILVGVGFIIRKFKKIGL